MAKIVPFKRPRRPPSTRRKRGPADPRIILAAVAVLGVAGYAAVSPSQTSVTDGDTFRRGEERVRLWGIDAPEAGQTCDGPSGEVEPGSMATDVLSGLLRALDHCVTMDVDQYGRTVAVCFTEGGADIGAEIVRQGWAWDYTHFSGGEYAAEQAEAQNASSGVWAMRCEPPWEWRRR